MVSLIRKICCTIVCSVTLCSCSYNDITGVELSTKEGLVVNCSLKELCAQQGRITEDLVASGVVLTSDSTGNFFREILVGEFTGSDTTIMRLPLYFYDTYSLFPRGAQIAISGSGLFMGVSNNLRTLGYTPLDGSSTPEAIPTPTLALEHIQNTGNKCSITPLSVTIDELSLGYVGRCVVLCDSYFTESLGSYSGEREIAQLGSQNTINLYTSSYCSFANDSVPYGLFTIEAIVECYNDEIQLKIVDEQCVTQKK